MLGCNFDSLALICGSILTPYVHFLHISRDNVLGSSQYEGLILYTYIGDKGGLVLEKCKNVRVRKVFGANMV